MLDTNNRVELYAVKMREVIASGEKADGSGPIGDLAALDADMAVSFEEHFAYQQAQALAHADGTLSTEEAMTVYRALGEVGSDANGGWASGTDLALKVAVTNLMTQLLARRIGDAS